MTALSQAIQNKRWRQARLLIEAGSDINWKGQDKRSAIMEWVDYNLNAVDRNGNTALFHTITVGDVSIVKMIVKKLKHYGLSVDTQNSKGETPLIHALKLGHTQCADILIEEGKASLEVCDLEYFKTAAQWKIEMQRNGKRIISPFYTVENKVTEKSKKKLRKTVSAKAMKVCLLPDIVEKKNTKKDRPLTAPDRIKIPAFFSPCTPVQEDLLRLYGIFNQQTTSSYRKGYKFVPKPVKPLPPLAEEETEEGIEENPAEQGKSKLNFSQINEINVRIKGLQKAVKNRKNSSSPLSNTNTAGSPLNSEGSVKSGKKNTAKLLRKGESMESLGIEISLAAEKH
ncbi:Ankyrin repeat and KH domain-containing protein mask [Stylophora pistillata]|uniref:Ankyrin repeat and KH domain-containing protein mask n=1 Tax=Stylophora pistillata TaxID=50429 RepID=A0A2B4RQ01_STYPI|nr:Ankyrin repeat and KH domain-containing protein mask [Stylophora pistillata]